MGHEGRRTLDEVESISQIVAKIMAGGTTALRSIQGGLISDDKLGVWKVKAIAFGDTTPVSCVALVDGDVVSRVLVRVTTVFAGGTPALDIGDDDDDDGYLPNAGITETSTGWYGEQIDDYGLYLKDVPESGDAAHRMKAYTAAKTVKCKLSSSLTAGVAEVWVLVANLIP